MEIPPEAALAAARAVVGAWETLAVLAVRSVPPAVRARQANMGAVAGAGFAAMTTQRMGWGAAWRTGWVAVAAGTAGGGAAVVPGLTAATAEAGQPLVIPQAAAERAWAGPFSTMTAYCS